MPPNMPGWRVIRDIGGDVFRCKAPMAASEATASPPIYTEPKSSGRDPDFHRGFDGLSAVWPWTCGRPTEGRQMPRFWVEKARGKFKNQNRFSNSAINVLAQVHTIWPEKRRHVSGASYTPSSSRTPMRKGPWAATHLGWFCAACLY